MNLKPLERLKLHVLIFVIITTLLAYFHQHQHSLAVLHFQAVYAFILNFAAGTTERKGSKKKHLKKVYNHAGFFKGVTTAFTCK